MLGNNDDLGKFSRDLNERNSLVSVSDMLAM